VSSKPSPDQPVVMGRILAPFGVKGWVKIQPYTATARSLADYPVWWLEIDGGGWRESAVEAVRPQGTHVVAKLAGCDDRDAAAAVKGLEVAVPRAALPAAAPGEYYWTDLLGLQVENERAQELGVVARMMETGANAVLVVEGDRERLIPFISDVVKSVDLESRSIVVDWDADY
jgi:16S rRNA processing protein RimM